MNSLIHAKYAQICSVFVALAISVAASSAYAQPVATLLPETAQPQATTPPPAPADPAAMAQVVREQALEQARADYEKIKIGGPITLMSICFTLALPVTLIGLVINGVSDKPGTLIAGIGLGIGGVASASWLAHRVNEKKVLGARIRELESGRPGQLSLGVSLRPENAGLSMRMNF